MTRLRALALVDGEHYPPVVRAALERAGEKHDVVAALLAGGQEKLDGDPDYGLPVERSPIQQPLHESMLEAAARHGAQRILDLSDEPVVGEDLRMRLAAHAAAAGLEYVGPDFTFHAPTFTPLDVPALAVIGTGKRIGKTAVAGYTARLLDSRGHVVIVVAMGRGGPEVPELVEGAGRAIGVADLLARADAGEHAASDFLEDAALARVTTIGARRCGGGLLGQPYLSNVVAAAELAAARRPDILLLEGSGAAVPPVRADRTVLVASAAAGTPLGRGLGAYRVLISDVVVLTMCEPPYSSPEDVVRARAAVADVDAAVPVVATMLRPAPVEPVTGRPVAYFTTAGETGPLVEHLQEEHGVEVVFASGALGDRARLRADLASPEVAAADVYLVEIKAAAIDVVARTAAERGVEVVFCDNRPVALPGEPDLDDVLGDLATEAVGARA